MQSVLTLSCNICRASLTHVRVHLDFGNCSSNEVIHKWIFLLITIQMDLIAMTVIMLI